MSKSTAAPPPNKSDDDVFRPLSVPAAGRGAAATELRYKVGSIKEQRRLNVLLPATLYRAIRPNQPEGWRLDINPAKKRARLTALIQMDTGARRHRPRADEKSLTLSWPWVDEAEKYFPEKKGVTPFKNVSVTSMGIEFDLPAAK